MTPAARPRYSRPATIITPEQSTIGAMRSLNMITSLELLCRDAGESATFYQALTGAEPLRSGFGPHATYTLDLGNGSRLRLRQRPGRKKTTPAAEPDGFGLTVDADAPVRVMRLGADVLGGRVAVDPDGRRITMHMPDR